MDHTKLKTKMRKDAPSKKALTDEMSFRVCRLWAYSKTRRGLPKRPTRNSGKKVKLKKTKNVQKWILAEPLVQLFARHLREASSRGRRTGRR